MIFAVFAALIPVGLIAILAFSKKTNPAVKRASIVALILIAMAFITCSIILFVMLNSSAEERAYGGLPVVPLEEPKPDLHAILIALAIVFSFVMLTIILLLREQRKKGHL